jgi:hypothetical protein
MIHFVFAIVTLVLLWPTYSIYKHLSEVNFTMTLATLPQIYTKLHSESFLDDMEMAHASYSHHTYELGGMLTFTLLVMALLWFSLAGGVPVGAFPIGAAACLISATIVTLWNITVMPVWLFNLKLDVVKAREQINIGLVQKRIAEVKLAIALIPEPMNDTDKQKLVELSEEATYLILMNDSLQINLDNLPERFNE